MSNSKGTILFVEDNKAFRKIYGDRLSLEGFDILEADDGQKALEVLRAHTVNLIMADINMPNMDGFGLIEAVRKDEALKNIPILVMSVFDTQEYLKKARDLGANGYVIKGTQTPNEVCEKAVSLIS